ncbi:MAG: lasso peptide biosynthesis B2 protein, partial [Thermoanaerobaculia bacterium]
SVPTPNVDMPRLQEVILMLHAGRLVLAAQALRRGQSLPQTLDTMCGLRGLPSSIGAGEGHLAVERAASRLGRFGLTDTCLIRSLALATLLADRDEVQLHIGFRSTDSIEVVLSGHAWVTLGGRALPDDHATLIDGRRCEEVAVLAATRPGARQDCRETR